MKAAVGLLGRIAETRTARDKATKNQEDEVRRLLKELGREKRVSLPCIFDEENTSDYDWEAISVQWLIMCKDEDPEYTLKLAEEDTGQHSIRIMAPEISYFYGEVEGKKKIEQHWGRIFEVVDSFDRCPNSKCKKTRIPAWIYCGWCGIQLQFPEEEEAAKPAENPTS